MQSDALTRSRNEPHEAENVTLLEKAGYARHYLTWAWSNPKTRIAVAWESVMDMSPAKLIDALIEALSVAPQDPWQILGNPSPGYERWIRDHLEGRPEPDSLIFVRPI